MAIRRKWVGGNWKCNGTQQSMEDLCATLSKAEFDDKKVDVVVCPPPAYMSFVKSKLPKEIKTASQNCSKTGVGAFTGETSVEMLMDLGIEWTLIGHSERRQFYNESDDVVAEKLNKVLNKSPPVKDSKPLSVALCIGESLQEREEGKTNEVCARQIKACIPNIKDWDRIVIAYEPVWAIGTGKVATPEQAQEAHEAIRELLRKEVSAQVAESTRIVYGGSVSESNCDTLSSQPDIDGFLVGGASLKPGFLDIIKSVGEN